MSHVDREASFISAVLRRPVPEEVGGDLGVELVLRLSNARATRVFRSLVPSTVRRQTWTSGKSSFAIITGSEVEAPLLTNDGGKGLMVPGAARRRTFRIIWMVSCMTAPNDRYVPIRKIENTSLTKEEGKDRTLCRRIRKVMMIADT